jgi:Ser-tRNA(Ala) deacylase AlaX
MDMREIQKETKKRFPIGCYFRNTQGSLKKLEKDDCTYSIDGNMIYANYGMGCLYDDGIWAKLCDQNGNKIYLNQEPQYEIY